MKSTRPLSDPRNPTHLMPLKLYPHRRAQFAVFGTCLTMLDLSVKLGMERLLYPDGAVGLGVLDLKVTYNSGVAFSMGSQLPASLIVALTGVASAALVAYAWQTIPILTRAAASSVTLVSAGALGNMFGRITDGVVTDYLHTGWFPSFNLADCFITAGAAGLLFSVLRNPHASSAVGDRR